MTHDDSSDGAGDYGYRHPPAGDIDEIRELLRGYGSEESLLKELIQNAEDAEAERLVFMLVAGDPASPHPLLRTAGLCVVNDGVFRPDHLEAMSRLRIGTKGKDARAIGRFGKGLKSVYSVCEAFFVVAATDPALGWPGRTKSRFFNPRSGWRHQDWDSAYRGSQEAVVSHVTKAVDRVRKNDKPWLAFWLPLRHPDHQTDSKGRIDWIHPTQNQLPGDNSKIGQDLANVLASIAPSLAILRNLVEIVVDDQLGSQPLCMTWSVETGSSRASSPGDSEAQPLQGRMSLLAAQGANTAFSYRGFVGTLKDPRANEIKQSDGWPSTVSIAEDGSSSDDKTKGEAHFGAIFSGMPSKAGKLRIKWAVFLPVGDQPVGTRECNLKGIPCDVTLTLHGFAFLDTQRTRIDWLDECFKPASNSSRQACLDWNRFVMEVGALAHLPEALAAFVSDQNFDMAQISEITGALKSLWVWHQFKEAICGRYYWVPRWSATREVWSLVGAGEAMMVIPAVRDAASLMRCVPGLAEVAVQHVLVQEGRDGLPGLHCGGLRSWPEKSVLQLLQRVQLELDENEAASEWLNRFLDTLHRQKELTPTIHDRVADLPLLPVKDARTEKRRWLSLNDWKSLTGRGLIVRADAESLKWLPILLPGLPNWTANIVDVRCHPEWSGDIDAPRCSGVWVAQQVLSQKTLAPWNDRVALTKALAGGGLLDATTVQAVRYLMHTNAAHAHDSETLLFLPSSEPQEKVWGRLTEQILSKLEGDHSWRSLHEQWIGTLAGNLYNSLNVVEIDANGVWKELMRGGVDVGSLSFPSADWSETDLSSVMAGLFQTGNEKPDDTRALLRRLAMHSLRGAAETRVPISDANGELAEGYVLDVQGFDASLPTECDVQWREILEVTRIVKRLPDSDLASAVQSHLFHRIDNDGESFDAELDWSFVVRRCLQLPDPCTFSRLILHALSHGHEAVQGLGKKLKESKWLPLILDGQTSPAAVVLIEGLDTELERMLDPKKDGVVAALHLPGWVREHLGFRTLRQYFPGTKASLEMLGTWLEDKDEWLLGLTESVLPDNLDELFDTLETLEDLPGGRLLAKLRGLEEGLEPLLKETIWKSLLKPFACEGGRQSRLEGILVRLATHETRVGFDAYLRQASADGHSSVLLPHIRVINGRGQWMPAAQLAWPSASLDPSMQVCKDQAIILDPQRDTRSMREPGTPLKLKVPVELPSAPDFAKEVQKLANYLQPFRDSNIGSNLPAALVAVLGGQASMLKLLKVLLSIDIRQSPDDFLLRLLGERSNWLAPDISKTNFLIEIVRGNNVQVESLTGSMLQVELAKSVDSLLVGDQEELSRPHRVLGSPVLCRRLRLRHIADPDQLDDPMAVFIRTVEMVMTGTYQFCPAGLAETISEIGDSGQSDLKRSQSYLLDMAEARLKELGARESPVLDKILRTYDEARLDRVEFLNFKKRSPARANELYQRAQQTEWAARRELEQLLTATGSADVRQMLVAAVRRKMVAFEYFIASVVMELFQNADDAVAELGDMRGNLESGHRKFVLRLNPELRVLDLIHWGRPINQHSFGQYTEGRHRGFDQDLHKMLTLNFSEKGIGTENSHAASVTGRFGLGFKSVFFVSEEPKVVSGRLGFQIRGGFYPVSLPPEDAKELRDSAAHLNDPGLVATVIRLQWEDSEIFAKIAPIVERFRSLAPLLTIFSRCVETIVVAEGSDPRTISCDELCLMAGGAVSRILVGDLVFLALRCQIPQDKKPTTILLPMDTQGVSKLPEELPRLWITTPTIEKSDLGWALNAPFKPDAGRQRVALNNPANQDIAENVARRLGATLIELFDAMKLDWDLFAGTLKLHSDTTFEGWWKTFWREMTASTPICEWHGIQAGGQILSWIAWNYPGGAVRHFVRHRATIPSDLSGSYEYLVTSEQVRFCVDGILAEVANGVFARVAQWEVMQMKFPPGTTVGKSVGVFLEDARCVDSLTRITLEQTMAGEVGPDNHVAPAVAHRFGSLLKECQAHFESIHHTNEIKKLEEWMAQMNLLTLSGTYHSTKSLVCDRAVMALIENDEVLRAQFAPRSLVLSREYSTEGVAFFVRARGRLLAGAAVLAEWVAEAQDEKLPQIFAYLIAGQLGQELADRLERTWLEARRDSVAYNQLSKEDISELVRKFSRGYDLSGMMPPVKIEEPIEPEQVMPAETAFRLVSSWWSKERSEWVKSYEDKTYPPGLPGALPWPGDDSWDASSAEPTSARSGWLVIFINAALLPLGFNRIGRDRSFISYLLDRRWISVLEGIAQNPGALMEALDNYLDEDIQRTAFHFQMRQLIAFYASAKNLESYVEALRQAEKSQTNGAFNSIFSPRANPALTGTGIDAPPLGGMLGMGSSQLLRELYRLNRLQNPEGYPFAFTPIRKVRRLCAKLFGTSDAGGSEDIYRALTELGERCELDPTFGHCFDLPFQILAENDALRDRVLKVEFEMDLADEDDSDAAPPNDLQPVIP